MIRPAGDGEPPELLAVVRCSNVFVEQHRAYADGPKLVAACAFLYGRDHGRWEAGAIEEINLPDRAHIAAEVKGRPDLREVLRELRECARESVRRVAEAMRESIGVGVGMEALSQWEGIWALLPAAAGRGAAGAAAGLRARE